LVEAKTDFKAKAELRKLIRKNTEHAGSILEKHKAQMVSMGISKKCVDVATRPRLMGLAKDVLDCPERGLYDAVVVGGRGLSRVQKAFMGSLTAKLVEHCRVVPVWVIDGQVTSTRFLVAVDGPEASLRMLRLSTRRQVEWGSIRT
jgi:hypothetical protein